MKRVRIIRAAPIEAFANVVYAYREQIYRLWIISPWIGAYTDGSVDPLQLMMDAIRSRPNCMVNVITREPKPNADWHKNALSLLRANVKPTMFFCKTLHTKLYIMESDGMTSAMLGSPNLTVGGNKENRELALELRGAMTSYADEISSTLYELVRYANDLLKEDDVKVAP